MNAGKSLLLLSLVATPAWADDRIDHIRAAAAEVRSLDLATAQQTVLNCYRDRKPYETCVAQDFIVANVAARSSHDPLGVLEEMAARVIAALARNDVQLEDAQQLILLVKAHGFQRKSCSGRRRRPPITSSISTGRAASRSAGCRSTRRTARSAAKA
jgi:hypothetical protein